MMVFCITPAATIIIALDMSISNLNLIFCVDPRFGVLYLSRHGTSKEASRPGSATPQATKGCPKHTPAIAGSGRTSFRRQGL
jgi:hypothetical protein